MKPTLQGNRRASTAVGFHNINIAGLSLSALASGSLWWSDAKILTVSDLHLGKSDRISRRGGPNLPPYDTRDTLSRLESDIQSTGASTVICLGDSFDDLQAAHDLNEDDKTWIKRLQAGRRWVWIAGNHDPGPLSIGGTHLNEFKLSGLTFRHMAVPDAVGEISGHYHPKFTLRASGQRISRPCFIYDSARLILPAYGTYTGGLIASDTEFRKLFKPDAQVVITGKNAHVFALTASGSLFKI